MIIKMLSLISQSVVVCLRPSEVMTLLIRSITTSPHSTDEYNLKIFKIFLRVSNPGWKFLIIWSQLSLTHYECPVWYIGVLPNFHGCPHPCSRQKDSPECWLGHLIKELLMAWWTSVLLLYKLNQSTLNLINVYIFSLIILTEKVLSIIQI